MIQFTTFLALSALLVAASSGEEYDLVIYGGTSASVAAAVQAKRMGKSVVMVSPDKHLGGLTSSGLGWTDSGRKEVIGGISREFYQRLKKHYDQPEAWQFQKSAEYSHYRPDDDAMWVFEPKVAEAAFEALVKENAIPVFRNEWLDRQNGVAKAGGRITSIATLSGKTFVGRVFLDTTYEGDLMAAAGVSFTLGREGNSVYGETLNGVQVDNARKHQFEYPVSAYVVPGDPSSGLLPKISSEPPGEQGAGDRRIQAYNFRVCLTQVPDNRFPFPKPEGYDPGEYALLARYLEGGWEGAFRKFDPAPNGKTDTNNHGAFSTDNIGMNYDYPEASYERRREIIAEHEAYQKGWFYFLANDPSVREDVRNEMSTWGLANDEFLDNGHWPHQIYVREARRMVSDFVMTENHLRGVKPTPDSIGMGSYNMDSHNTQRYVDADGNVRNEGDVQANPGGPYPVSYQAIVPKSRECTNLLVPVCVSSSHIAYGSIRMEPVFMILGQSAATAAALAIDHDTAVQNVDYAELKARLLADGQALEMTRPPHPPKIMLNAKSLPGFVLDDDAAKLTGEWSSSSSTSKYVGPVYLHDGNEGKGEKSARWETKLKPGRYEVLISHAPSGNRASNVPVSVTHAGGTVTLFLDQKQEGKTTPFSSLGEFDFGGTAVVEVSTKGTSGHVIVDAVQFLPR